MTALTSEGEYSTAHAGFSTAKEYRARLTDGIEDDETVELIRMANDATELLASGKQFSCAWVLQEVLVTEFARRFPLRSR